MVDEQQVKHIAALARLRLTETEISDYGHKMGEVLDYIHTLDKAQTEGIEPTCFMLPQHDPMRDDVAVPSLPATELLKNAPLEKNGFFAIPKVINLE